MTRGMAFPFGGGIAQSPVAAFWGVACGVVVAAATGGRAAASAEISCMAIGVPLPVVASVARFGIGIAGDVRDASEGAGDGSGLVAGTREDHAVTAARRTALAAVVPDGFLVDDTVRGRDAGTARCEHVGRRCREVDVVLAVVDAVTGAVVAGGNRDGDAEQGGFLGNLVEVLHGLRGPGAFRATPADGYDRRLVELVVDGSAEGVLETAP